MIDKVFGATKWAAAHDSVSRLNDDIATLQQVTSYCSATATPIRFFRILWLENLIFLPNLT